jgi:isoaspartyl peptidase/L-asparaginase-like protein (Ntn-hydrolase superfamily)
MEPVVISTWKHGVKANEKAYEILTGGGNSLDAVEQGVKAVEDDPNVLSVGYGGLPDNEGRVTLDAAIMDWKARIGAVIFLEHIKNPISVARLILEKTEHTILAGDGAYKFALMNGFESGTLLTETSIRRFKEWKASEDSKAREYHTEDFELKPLTGDEKKRLGINDDGNHDTIGMVAIDTDGHVSASCTTSGTAWKLHGRVGDSPIIGAGLYVDGSVGGAVSTGRGEECIRACGSFLVVEMMRQGKSPQEACEIAAKRVIKLNLLSHHNRDSNYQIGFVALNLDGEYGAVSVREGFEYVLHTANLNELRKSKFIINEGFDIGDL